MFNKKNSRKIGIDKMDKKRNKKDLNLITDEKTDYLHHYFANEDKFNDQLRDEFNKDIAKKLEEQRKELNDEGEKSDSCSSNQELPSDSSSNEKKDNVDFNDEESVSRSDLSESPQSPDKTPVKSPYAQKIESIKKPAEIKQEVVNETIPVAAFSNVAIETVEQRRARAREAYSNLQDLVERYGVKLSRNYTIDDDPDEMEEEYKSNRDKRHKNNQIKFYQRVLLNVIAGVEFLNDKYDPFSFKLKDWSKQVASDMDEYTEVLEELYEKYKDRGGRMAPEVRLLLLIVMSAVTFHLSQTLFGSGGLENTIKNNPSIINKIIGPLLKGDFGKNDDSRANEAPKDNQKILETLRKQNGNLKTEVKDESVESNASKDALAQEREKRLLAEQRAAFESQLRKQSEMYTTQLQQMRNQSQMHHAEASPVAYKEPVNTEKTNYILSDANKKPRFQSNPALRSEKRNENEKGIFSSEMKNRSDSKGSKFSSIKQAKNISNYDDEIFDSLGSSESSPDMDADDIIETSSKKNKSKNNSVKSIGKRRGSDFRSDGLSSSKRKNNNVFKL